MPSRILLLAKAVFFSSAVSFGCYGVPESGGVGAGGAAAGTGMAVDSAAAGVSPCGPAPVSFTGTIQPILQSCVGNGACHQNSYTKWTTISASGCISRKVIDPGHPESSYILNKLTNTNLCIGDPMPKTVPWQPLPPEQIQLISNWICQGALYN
jgi:hypothetical protein